MESNRKVAGKRPDCSRPDQEEQFGMINMAEFSQIVLHRELDINGRAGVIVILDFSLCKGRLVLGTPVHGFEAFIDMAVPVHLAEDTDFIRFKALVHGFVGMIPVSDYAEAFEALPLHADIFFRIGLTGTAEFGSAHSLVVELLLLDNGGFDRHAMVVPPGDIRRPVSAHGVGTDNKIL